MSVYVAPSSRIDVRRVVDEQARTGFNLWIVVLGAFAMFADGYSLNSVGFAAPYLVHQWHVARSAYTPILMISLVAVLIGSPLLSFVGDRWGRKAGAILSLAILAITSFLCMYAHNLTELFVLRFFAGIALGGVNPNIFSIVAEFSPRRVRTLMMSLCLSGVLVGASSAGWVSAFLAGHFGWQAIFFVGGVLPAIAILEIGLLMPESIKYLTLRGGPGSSAAITRLIQRLKPDEPVGPSPEYFLSNDSATPFRPQMLFAGSLLFITPLLWLLDGLNFMVSLFVVTWAPTLFISDRVPVAAAALITSTYNLAGVVSGAIVAALLDRIGFAGIAIIMFFGAVSVGVIGTPGMNAQELAVLVAAAGFFVQGAQGAITPSPGLNLSPVVQG